MVALESKKISCYFAYGIICGFPSEAVVRPDEIEGGTKFVLPPEHKVGAELHKTEIGIVEGEGFGVRFIGVPVLCWIVGKFQGFQAIVDIPGL